MLLICSGWDRGYEFRALASAVEVGFETEEEEDGEGEEEEGEGYADPERGCLEGGFLRGW